MEINLKEGFLEYQDFKVPIKGHNLVGTQSKNLYHSDRDSFFLAYLNPRNKACCYRMPELDNVVLVGCYYKDDIWMYVVRQRKSPDVLKTVCVLLRYLPELDRYRELDEGFIKAEMERLGEYLQDYALEKGVIYVYNYRSYLDAASFLMEKINFKNEPGIEKGGI